MNHTSHVFNIKTLKSNCGFDVLNRKTKKALFLSSHRSTCEKCKTKEDPAFMIDFYQNKDKKINDISIFIQGSLFSLKIYQGLTKQNRKEKNAYSNYELSSDHYQAVYFDNDRLYIVGSGGSSITITKEKVYIHSGGYYRISGSVTLSKPLDDQTIKDIHDYVLALYDSLSKKEGV